ncbi:hypothetical protein LCGC14_1183090 [marine sediment metagenome]|uniref:Uncharacterized protein n=1 Tax=marine sediment metagenome TaxID=412755 RepID=A0A0F9LRC9_9ZZZZ
MNKDIMRAMGFGKDVEKVEQGICPFCDKPVNKTDFRDLLSHTEYGISGLCQKCQDNTFKR